MREVWNETNLLMLLGELQGEQKEHEERNDVKWNRLNEKLYVRLLDVNAKRRKENRIYKFILSFIYFQCALRHTSFAAETHCDRISQHCSPWNRQSLFAIERSILLA